MSDRENVFVGIKSAVLLHRLPAGNLRRCEKSVCAAESSADDFQYEIKDGTATVTGYDGIGADIAVPARLGGCPVTAIGCYAFHDCEALIAVTLPERVTEIAAFSFAGCSGLRTVKLPDGLRVIGDYAFAGCKALTTVALPGHLTAVGDDAFYGCAKLPAFPIGSVAC